MTIAAKIQNMVCEIVESKIYFLFPPSKTTKYIKGRNI